ncbi:MAG TPA: hypothetical protein VLF61_01780 [Rhabdochlamydiaceae bacterium]|nr:hypothetical protein [Rhabdochlamydiaceae bacterium]
MSFFKMDPGFQAFRLLQIAFVVAPILAGADKVFMTNFLVPWPMYLSPILRSMFENHIYGFMMFVGIVEVIAGVGVAVKPKLFSCIVALWLLLIIINLLTTGHYFDIALRDLGLFLSALALCKLSEKYAK